MNREKTIKVGGAFAAAVPLLCLLFLSSTAHSQVVNDGATATLNHVTNTISGSITVGTNGPFTLLILTNGTLLTNSENGTIGLNTSANSNTVRLTSANTRWLMSLDLSIGSNGSVNHLVITNGPRVENNFGGLGIAPASSNNDALVTGSASIWSNRNDLFVGYDGHGNSLVVSNGGTLANNAGILGVDPPGSNNLVTVSGPGSLWSNRASLFIGFSGSGNRLVASNAAAVFASTNVSVGFNPGSSNNLVLISGGALMTNAGSAIIGYGTGANSNAVFLSGTNTAWLVGRDFLVGSNGALNRLVVSNGALLINQQGILGNTSTSSSNQALITGPGSVWSNSSALSFGTAFDANGGHCALVVSNGALVISRSDIMNGNNNVVVVTGTNSVWTNQFGLSVGNLQDGNSLNINGGGQVLCQDGFIGQFVGSQNNEAFVTGGGSLWSINSGLTIGLASSGNSLIATKGGTVWVGDHLLLGNSFSSAATNVVNVYLGTLLITNAAQMGLYVVRGGTNIFSGGRIEADQLLITNALGAFEFNGGTLTTRGATISNDAPFVVGLTGSTPAIWDLRAGPNIHSLVGQLIVGSNSSFNQLFITNGATLTNTSGGGSLGANLGANSNTVFLSGPGSQWLKTDSLLVGENGAFNRLVVSNGALMSNHGNGTLGNYTTSSNNEAVVTDAGSLWISGDELTVGEHGSANRLIVTNGGTVIAANRISLGLGTNSLNNRIIVDGGTLQTTNNSFLIQGGTNVLNSGQIEVDQLLMTSTQGKFEFNGGTLLTGTTTNNNGLPFNVGNGSSAATLTLAGFGNHSFANGLVIRSNASLIGNGTIIGTLTVQNGGRLSPGTSLGLLTLNNPPVLRGTTVMEINNNGTMLPNDQIAVTGTLPYGGALIVTNIGVNALTAGVEFPLFNANSYGGSFASITLPPLSSGLTWTNKLLVDGSIQIIAALAPKFAIIALSGTNVVISGTGGPTSGNYHVLTSTNIILPLSNWTSLLTNQFDGSGNFVFTNTISPAMPQRFYRLQLQ